ncbi:MULTISPECIES: hypothetical protein [Pseudomonadaceae]|uniref:hypothetical protein n=1 Tax=Pseudomonas solani TaxID=2731552 RepID=UPI0011DE033F
MKTAKICDSCKTVLRSRDPINEFAKRIATLAFCGSDCGNETQSASDFSPGVVESDEELASCVCHPNHTDKDGEVVYKASDFAFTHGMSVTRLSHKDGGLESVISFCRDTFCKPGRDYRGTYVFKASAPRGVFWRDGTRAFMVLDTAGKSLIAHADVIATRYHGDLARLASTEKLDRLKAQISFFRKMKPVDESA